MASIIFKPNAQSEHYFLHLNTIYYRPIMNGYNKIMLIIQGSSIDNQSLLNCNFILRPSQFQVNEWITFSKNITAIDYSFKQGNN